MGPARFAEPADQRGLVRFEKYKPGGHLPADSLDQGWQTLQGGPFADVHHQSGMPDVRGILGQLGKLWDQLDGQVIDRIIPQIFECLEDCSLARTAQSGDDDQLLLSPSAGGTGGNLGRLPDPLRIR